MAELFELEYRLPGEEWQPMYGRYTETAKNTAVRVHTDLGYEVRVFATRRLASV